MPRTLMTSPSLDPSLVSLKAPGSFAAEQYQGLRMTVERLKKQQDVRLIAISSASAGDGKTVTAINLAGMLARDSNAHVLLIDADLRRPAVASRLGIAAAGAPGLGDAVGDAAIALDAITHKVEGFNLWVVTAGTGRFPIHEVLRSPRLERLLQEAREQYDFVVLDTPPLLPVFDATQIARMVDGLLIVVAANHTPKKLLAEALTLLEPSSVLGLVFNRDTQPLFGYYGSAYRHYFQSTGAA
jgi:protein-tyrosine kinase